jgi:hypothetical protein
VADDIADLRPTLKDLQWAMEHRDRKILEWWFRGRHEMTPELYDFLADLMAGNFKLPKLPKRGGRRKTFTERWNDNFPLMAGERLVERYKRVWRLRYGRKYRVHEEALEKAVARLQQCGIKMSTSTLDNYLKRSRKDRRRRM